jgi:hypothetical protein
VSAVDPEQGAPVSDEGLRELLAAATPTPWVHAHEGLQGGEVIRHGDVRVARVYKNNWPTYVPDCENAALIVAAVNALPDLLDRLAAVEAERDHWHEEALRAFAGTPSHSLAKWAVDEAMHDEIAATARAESAEAARDTALREKADVEARMGAVASKVKREADEQWTAHSEASDMYDLDAANHHGGVAEILDETYAALRAALAIPTATGDETSDP